MITAPDAATPALNLFVNQWNNRPADPQARENFNKKLLDCFNECTASFHKADQETLDNIAKELSEQDPLRQKIQALTACLGAYAGDASLFTGLPLEVKFPIYSQLSFRDVEALECVDQNNQSSLIEFYKDLVEKPGNAFSLESLNKLLTKCGTQVTQLDFSKLLNHDDNSRMTDIQLQKFLALCPNLEGLVLYENKKITNEGLKNTIQIWNADSSISR